MRYILNAGGKCLYDSKKGKLGIVGMLERHISCSMFAAAAQHRLLAIEVEPHAIRDMCISDV